MWFQENGSVAVVKSSVSVRTAENLAVVWGRVTESTLARYRVPSLNHDN